MAALVILFLIFLFGIACFSFHRRYQKEKSIMLILVKDKIEKQKILTIKKEIDKLKNQNKIKFSESLENNNLMNFESEQLLLLAKFEDEAFTKKIIFPNNFFSELQKNFILNKNSEKSSQIKQSQFFLIKKIIEKILIFPKLKVTQLELAAPHEKNSLKNEKDLSLGIIFLSITAEEKTIKNIINKIFNNNFNFIISSIEIFNSHCISLSCNAFTSNEKLLPILGGETVTAKITINLLNLSEKSADKKLEWSEQKDKTPLFSSKHYAVQNKILIDPIKYPKIIFPPIPNTWIVDNNLDYSNQNLLFEDPDQTGFNNLEKWAGDNPREEPGKFSSDPNNPISHPLLWTKLQCYEEDIINEVYGIYFLGTLINNNEVLFKIQPVTPLISNSYNRKMIRNKKIRYASMYQQIEGLPYKIINYEEKNIIYKNTSYDNSELTVENINTKEKVVIIKKTPYNNKLTNLNNIKLIKIKNTIFNPPEVICLKIGDYFSLDYFLKNRTSGKKDNLIERECYQLITLSNNNLIVKKDSREYKIPIIPHLN